MKVFARIVSRNRRGHDLTRQAVVTVNPGDFFDDIFRDINVLGAPRWDNIINKT